MTNRNVYLYAFDELHHVVELRYLREGRVSEYSICQLGKYILDGKPNIKVVYAVVNRTGLKQDFLDTLIKPHFTKDLEFEDLIRREAINSFYR